MPHVPVDEHIPGIRGLWSFKPSAAKPMMLLAQELLRGPSSLTPVQRERIATHVSAANECRFCERSHEAAMHALAEQSAPGDGALMEPAMDALLELADVVRVSGSPDTADAIERARAAGADDEAVHDTVLIAAAFNMFNRYVDGLAAVTPPAGSYDEMGRLMATGYVR